MLHNILIVLAVVIVAFVIIAATQLPDFRTTRTAVMLASTSKVFEEVNDFHKWQAWSPWAKLDPAAKNTFEGPMEGTGAIFNWVGNNQVGEGRMTIIESYPNNVIRIRLDFLRPFAATNTAEFTFKAEGNQTVVTWSMYGKKNFISKAMGLIMNCDKMVGDQFEKGLASLKSVTETAR